MSLTSGEIVRLLAYNSYESVMHAVRHPGGVEGDLALRAVKGLGDEGRRVVADLSRKRDGDRMTTRGVRIQGALAHMAWRHVWSRRDPSATAKAVAWFYLAQASVEQRLEAWVASNAFTAEPNARVPLSEFQLKAAEAAAEHNWGRLTDLLRRRRSESRWSEDGRTCTVRTDRDVECVVCSNVSKSAGDFRSGVTRVQLRFGARSVDLETVAGDALVGRLGL